MVPFIVPPRNRDVTGDFHRPYEGHFPFNVPVGNRNVAGDFHRPYEGRVPSIVPVGNRDVTGDFHRPYESVPFIYLSSGVVLRGSWVILGYGLAMTVLYVW